MLQDETTGLTAEILRKRARDLYRLSGDATECAELLGKALEELELALEALQRAEDRLHASHEEHLNDRPALEQSFEHYRDLFIHAPLGYIATNPDGIVRQANARAESLLGTSERGLLGRSLSTFIPDGQRRKFRMAIAEHLGEEMPRRWELRLEPWQGQAFDTVLYSVVARAPSGRPQALRWLIVAGANVPAHADIERASVTHASANGARREGEAASVGPLFAALADVGVLAATACDVSNMFAGVADLLVPAVADGCIIDIDNQNNMKMRYIVTNPGRMLEVGADGDGSAFGSYEANGGASIRVPDDVPRGDTLRALIGALAPRSAIVTPLEACGEIFGSLTLIRSAAGRRYGSVEVALCEELARRLVAGVTRIQNSAARAQE
jgi:PAS domain S-box-containing protein